MNEMWALDFEASGLNLTYSYPIEVGYTNGIIEKSFLIKPLRSWSYWSFESEKIHNISMSELQKDGQSPFEVAKMMNLDLKGKDVFCDGGEWDRFWMNRLFFVREIFRQFELKTVNHDSGDEEVEHRALPDAIQLWNHLNDRD